jgi:hypothetical protein
MSDEAEVERLRVENARLHRGMSEGGVVEDGGAWEDRALLAEAEVGRLTTIIDGRTPAGLAAEVKRLRGQMAAATAQGYAYGLADTREARAEIERLTKWNAEDRAARKNELERAIEVRENANRVSVRVEMENDALLVEVERLREALELIAAETREPGILRTARGALGGWE